MANLKKMTAKEFREAGYLQELNRQFLHPMGMALEVVVEEDGSEAFGQVWDYRDDPEGIAFEEGLIDQEKVRRVEEHRSERAKTREAGLGFIIQE